jgi:N-acetylglucosaminyl-diphospho-decaprenol L-rhamnosyltransferase
MDTAATRDDRRSTVDRKPTLSIVIVSWNVWDLLRACLHAIESNSTPTDDLHLRQFGPGQDRVTLEVIVVDNASDDATPDLVPSRFPWVRFVAGQENLGFTRGCNRGYAASTGRLVYFLNPDTVPADGSLWQLTAAIQGDESIGVVGPQLRYPDGSRQSSRRHFPTPLTGFFESTWLGRLWPGNPWSRHYHLAGWPASFRQDVDWLTGAALLVRREALEEVGPFDENFFMYSEELDLCRRIATAGWRIVYVPEAVVVHYEGRSSGQVVAARHIHFNASKVLYYRKYFGPRWAELLRHYLLLEFRLQLALERLKFDMGHKRDLRQARVVAYREVIKSGLQGERASGTMNRGRQ